ncbi:MAG: c-type cytochrome [Methylophilaceae bacterium]
MKTSAYWLASTLALCTIATSALAAEDNHIQKLVGKVCSACHGSGGNSISPSFPKLAGQRASYLVAQLTSFRDRTRSDKDAQDAMWGWSRSLSDQDIKDLAAYYEAQKPMSGIPMPEALVKRGQQVFENGLASTNIPACATCHGGNAEGKDNIPQLAGQHAAYLMKQLKVFRTAGLRPAAVAMHSIVAGLTDEDMEAVAAYLQSK